MKLILLLIIWYNFIVNNFYKSKINNIEYTNQTLEKYINQLIEYNLKVMEEFYNNLESITKYKISYEDNKKIFYLIKEDSVILFRYHTYNKEINILQDFYNKINLINDNKKYKILEKIINLLNDRNNKIKIIENKYIEIENQIKDIKVDFDNFINYSLIFENYESFKYFFIELKVKSNNEL